MKVISDSDSTFRMASTSKETLLGKKVFMLERRLALVERFVELRFCKIYNFFALIRNFI